MARYPQPDDELWTAELDPADIAALDAYEAAEEANPMIRPVWSATYVLEELCAPHRVRSSQQEAQALRNFARAQRA